MKETQNKTRSRVKMNQKRKQKYIKRGILTAVTVVGVAIAAVVFNMVFTIIQDTQAFEADRLMRYQPFTILDKDDKEVFTSGVEPIEFDQVPQVLVDALVAAEDSRYYEHNGFDIPRIIKALIGNIIGGEISSGASTITQQTIKKNYYPNEEQTYTRKIGEIFLAIQADAKMDKNTILTCYLNTVYFGLGLNTQGIKAASNYYFGKEVAELTLPEAAYLAGVLNAPSSYDAYYHLDLATERRDIVLELMERHGYITTEEKELAQATKLENQLVKQKNEDLGYYQYQAYIDAVVEEAINHVYKEQYSQEEINEKRDELRTELLGKQITVHTYMDSNIQNYLEKEIATGNADNVAFYGDGTEVAGSIQDNYNGHLIALLGGRDYVDYTLNSGLEGPKIFGYNRATQGKTSPGSTLKPILAYGAGIEYLDWGTYSCITDDKYSTPGGVSIHNFDNRTHGTATFAEAIADSWNITACKAMQEVVDTVGQDKIIEYLNNLGLTVNDGYDAEGNLVPYGDFNILYAIGAWAEGITMVQETGAYAAVANGGKYYEPHTINYIEYNNNSKVINVDEDIAAKAKQAISEQTAFMIRELMIDYSKKYSYNYPYVMPAANNLGLSIGCKTGTATNSDDNDKSFLFTTFSSDYTMAFWIGKDAGNAEIERGNQYMSRAIAANVLYELHPDGTTKHEYTAKPSGVEKATVTFTENPSDTKYLANQYVPDSYKVTGYYKTSNPPKGAQSISVDQLTNFTVSSSNDSSIHVAFAPYNSKFTSDVDEDTIDIDRMYGRVLYSVVVKDASTGEALFSTTSENPEFSFDFDITTPISVCGKYQFSNASSLTSNEICRSISPKRTPLNPIQPQAVVSGNQVSVIATGTSKDNTLTVSIATGGTTIFTNSYKGSFSKTLTGLAPGVYTVTVTEVDKNQSNSVTGSTTFTIVDGGSLTE